ncbi:MAG: UvrD-helicase domain-containing protein [Deltaproteobacteria bacterium]|nr:UvrD-helicase domain-containing protein [Deltaproteobacteria bacterium]
MIARKAGRTAPDQEHRDRAVAERARNVLLDAGAGTGKTTILIERLVRLLAPEDDARPMEVHRIAAVTFTRRAAGELRLRLRERLLAELSRDGLGEARAATLRRALAGVDSAYVGTIHSFADRLLRLHPVEAGLSPTYEIAEEAGELVDEAFRDLLHGVQTGTLADLLRGTAAESRADEARDTVRAALAAGVPAGGRDLRYRTVSGLRELLAEFASHRDVPPVEPGPARFDAPAFRAKVGELLRLVHGVPDESRPEGVVWLRETAALLRTYRDETDPVQAYRELYGQLNNAPHRNGPRKSVEFAGNPAAWDAWKIFAGKQTGGHAGEPALRDEILAPFREWLAVGLVRTFPVLVALYERVKARRRVLDQLDLLARLRDLLRDDPGGVRARCQRLFDHVLIDEFQDTDPLQAEIAAFLCEDGSRAKSWEETRLVPGKLTIVGDPKQSIYRFRRADVAMYDEVRRHVLEGGPLVAPLTANFRSRPALIEFFNDRFRKILGEAPGDVLFDAAAGTVFHQDLEPGRAQPADGGRVHVLPLAPSEGKPKAGDWRRIEARALARYLGWLVEPARSGITVTDPVTRVERAVRYGDCAVLAISTPTLPLLFAELDEARIPWTARGGKLFLEDPLHRRFLLALRALADADDGAAEATLLRPPFFALDPAEHREWRGRLREVPTVAVRRVDAARGLVVELRRRRFERSPGATARDLLERSGLGRAVALSANGEQRLARLRELCSQVERLAAAEGLDFDGVSARLRAWVDDPAQLDPPAPVGVEALQVMTVHQAKGLEFPVVALWDCRAELGQRATVVPAWAVSRDRKHWMLSLDRVEWDSGEGFLEREKLYRNAERLRVVYVAATRARDLLVLPISSDGDQGPAGANPRTVTGALVAGAPAGTMHVLEPFRGDGGAPWAVTPSPAAPPLVFAAPAAEARRDEQWASAAGEASRPKWGPRGVAAAAHEPPTAAEDETESPRTVEGAVSALPAAAAARDAPEPASRGGRRGRFGPRFGDMVHLAIGHVVGGLDVPEAVRRAAARTGQADHLADAATDVSRAIDALASAGLLGRPGVQVRLEYPVAGPGPGGTLVTGYADFLAATPAALTLVDFKTDPPPEGSVGEAYPAYVAQLRTYFGLLTPVARAAGLPLRAYLLFTASGRLVEVEPPAS